MNADSLSKILGRDVRKVNTSHLCTLWAGYGSIQSLAAIPAHDRQLSHFILKVVNAPEDSGEAHERKLKSYEVEAAFYKHLALGLLSQGVMVAQPYLVDTDPTSHKVTILMDDLRSAFPRASHGSLGGDMLASAVDWLARFHAAHWEGVDSTMPPYNQLWPEGCYWRLDTRHSEYNDISSSWQRLKNCAFVVADLLKNGTCASNRRQHKTLVHGDFKSPNILFSEDLRATAEAVDDTIIGTQGRSTCAVVDFQYVGEGYGARDLVMLLVSSAQMPRAQQDAVALEKRILELYHSWLLKYIEESPAARQGTAPYTLEQLQKHYELCLVDYVRFMAGWGMWGNSDYAESRAREILTTIDGGKALSPAEYEQRFRAHYST